MSITKLEDVRKGDVGTVGGKAANLGELIGMGMPVPEGNVVTSLGPHVSLAGDGLGKQVAVRSSGIAEDGAKASMAGQHDTYLDVFNSPKFVVPAIRKCFESVNNPRAIAYREENGITEDRIAVIVQRMIDPLYCGVLFTADPVTGDRDTMCVEWVEGTGENLVSGEVIPESFEMLAHMEDKQDWQSTLHAYASNIEDHFGCPQDIEWCVDKENKLWILQARPITTL